MVATISAVAAEMSRIRSSISRMSPAANDTAVMALLACIDDSTVRASWSVPCPASREATVPTSLDKGSPAWGRQP